MIDSTYSLDEERIVIAMKKMAVKIHKQQGN